MKKIITATAACAAALLSGQITVGKTNPSASPANEFVSIEFGNATGGTKGMILPWVTNTATLSAPVPGILIFDSSDQKLKYGIGTAADATAVSGWIDLSNGAGTPAVPNIADPDPEISTAGTRIGGTPADTTNGILVLADTNKAMVLPRVDSYRDIVNPSAGMVVYVTSNNQLAIYNGREWTFWSK